jgi:hypothetical protein
MQKISFQKKAKTNTVCEKIDGRFMNYVCSDYMDIQLEDSIILDIDRTTFRSSLIKPPFWVDVSSILESQVKTTRIVKSRPQSKSNYSFNYGFNYDYEYEYEYEYEYDDLYTTERQYEEITGIDATKITNRNEKLIYYFNNYNHNKYFIEAKSVKLFLDWIIESKTVISRPHLRKTLKDLVESNYLTKSEADLYSSLITVDIETVDEVDEIIESKDLNEMINFINSKFPDSPKHNKYIWYLNKLLHYAHLLIQDSTNIFDHIHPHIFSTFQKMSINNSTLKYSPDIFSSDVLVNKLIDIGFEKLDLTSCSIWNDHIGNKSVESIQKIIKSNKSLRHIILSDPHCWNRDHSSYSDSIKNHHLKIYGPAIASASRLTLIEFRNNSFDRTEFINFLDSLNPSSLDNVTLTIKLSIKCPDFTKNESEKLNSYIKSNKENVIISIIM